MDAKTLIEEIIASGLNQGQVASEIRVTQSAVSKYLRGTRVDMGSTSYVMLLDLHQRRCAKAASTWGRRIKAWVRRVKGAA